MPEPRPDIVRAGHVEFGVTDLERARDFYVGLLGFVESGRDDDCLYLRGVEERDHHSLVLRRGGGATPPGVSHLAFRVAAPDDLELLAALAERQGLPWRRVEAGAEQGQGPALRVQDPAGLPLEFYHEMAPAERLLQRYDLHRGVPVLRIDHFNCQVPQVQRQRDWYVQELGFRVSEDTYAESRGADDTRAGLWAAWLYRKHTVHDLALMNGIGPRLHHAGFAVPDALAVLRACDIVAGAGHPEAIERGPGRHGLSNALFVYLRDPDGNRIELYTGDYLTADPDREPIHWRLDDPRRATFWGHAAPASWFEEAMTVLSITDGSTMPQHEPLLRDRPDFVT